MRRLESMHAIRLSAALAAFHLLSLAAPVVGATPSREELEALGAKLVQKEGVITELTITDCKKLGPAEFKLIGQVTTLKKLTLYGGCHGLNDETLPSLAGLKELEAIGTDGLKVTDDGLKHFAAFGKLKQASFFHTSFGMPGFTGVGFGHLKACPNLERLTVAGISMGDDGFAAIATITQLKDFSTWHTYQTEAGNAQIAKLPHLRSLKLGQRLPGKDRKATSLSDASLVTIASMKTLEDLKIGEARFTLEGVKALKSLPNLKSLLLYETDFPETAVEPLKQALPDVKVKLEPLTEAQRKKLDQYVPL